MKSFLFLASLLALVSPAFGQIQLTATSGTLSGNYTTLGAAFTAINNNVHRGDITIDVVGDTTETGAVLNNNGIFSVLIRPSGGAARRISGNVTNGEIITLNSAATTTIDGLNTGGNSLTISNTGGGSIGSGVLRLAVVRDLTVTNCTLLSNAAVVGIANNGGTIRLTGEGRLVTISGNQIGRSTANAGKHIDMSNASGAYSELYILNNQFSDWSAPFDTAAIYLGGTNSVSTCTISGNRFFQPSTQTIGPGQSSAIWITNTAISPLTISNNIVGFANAAGTGVSAYTTSTTCSLIPIFVRAGFTTIQGNTIAGMSFVASGPGFITPTFRGIRTAGGTGPSILANTIGSQTVTGSIVVNSGSNNSASACAIDSTSADSFTVNNNLIGGMTLISESGSLVGIMSNLANTSPALTCLDNTIGGTVADSMLAQGGGSLIVRGIRDASGTGTVRTNTVRNLTGPTFAGIRGSNVVSRNTIFGLRSTYSGGTLVSSGIELTDFGRATRNLVHGLTSSFAGATIHGIFCESGQVSCANNMIRLGLDAAGNSVTAGCAFNGITCSNSTTTCTVVYNSVYVGGTKVASSSDTFAMLSLRNTPPTINSNILVNARNNLSGTGKNYAIQVSGFVSSGVDNNIYLASGAGGFVGRYNGVDHQGIASWKTALGSDALSVEVDPYFVAPTAAIPDLHLTGTSWAEGHGGSQGISDDFDGETRFNLTPDDIGADAANFGPYFNKDAAALAIMAPNDGSLRAAGSVTPQARVCNQYLAANVPVRFRILDPSAVEIYNQVVTPSMAEASVAVVNFPTSASLTTPGVYTMIARTELPGDGLPANNSISGTFTILAPLSGTITVGAGGTYASLTNPLGAFDAINAAGVAPGGATLAIVSDLTSETGWVFLNAFSGGGQLRIQPSGGARAITGSNNRALLTFAGADNVLIGGSTSAGTAADQPGGTDSLRQLTITNLDPNFVAAVVLFSDAGSSGQNNTVRNVRIVGSSPTNTLMGIAIGGATAGAAGDHANMRVENCSFRRLRTGIFQRSSLVKNPGTVFTKNDLFAAPADRVSRVGIYGEGLNGPNVSLNVIGNLSSSESTDVLGIALGISQLGTAGQSNGIFNAVVSRNIVGGITTTASPVRSTAGIAVTSDPAGPNVISNNIVYGVIGATPANAVSAGIYVIGTAAGTNRLFYNSVFLSGDRGAATLGSYALAIVGTNPTVEGRNNIFANLQTSSGPASSLSYALGTGSTAPMTNLTLDRNLYYVAGPQAGGFRSDSLDTTGVDYATLAAWQAGTGKDPNSLFGDPLFVSATNLHLTAASPANNAGLPVAVTVDIDGETRSAGTPDLGADEIPPSAALSNLVLSSGTLSPAFSQAVFAYTASVGNAVNALTVTPTAVDGAATIQVQVNGGGYATVASGSPSASLPLNVGPNPIEVRVTAAGGSPVQTTTATLTRLDNLSAGVLNLSTSQGYARLVTQAELASAATFSPGFSPTILSAGPTSAQGGTIAFTVGVSATYNTPAPTFTGADSFSYTLQNSLGQMASGTVNMTVTAPAFPARPTVLTFGGGTFGGTFAVGIPGLQYRIDFSDNLLTAFAPLMVSGNPVIVTANSSGSFSFSDPTATVKRFYRAVPLP